MNRRGLVLVLAGGSALLVGLAIASAGTPQGKAWVDAPLEPATLLVGETLTVTAHATDPDGVDRMLLLVDQEVADVKEVDGRTLEFIRLTWTPSEPGTYGLSVWGSTAGGRMSALPGVIFVTVIGRTTTTTTAPPQTTTTGVCNPAQVAPTLISPGNGGTVSTATVTLQWSSTCPPSEYWVELFDPDRAFVLSEVTGATSSTFDLLPDYMGPYYWRVRAETPGPGVLSAVWTFNRVAP